MKSRTRYRLPKGMRYSTLEERRKFYKEEFDLKKLEAWLWNGRNAENTAFAMILGRHTGIYLEEYKKIRNNVVIIDEYKNLDDVKEYLLQYLPESVYYDRNFYSNLAEKKIAAQELAFDIDPENVSCPYHGDIEKKMKEHQGLGFCMFEFNAVKKATLALYGELNERFQDIGVVYSGRGFHLHVFDEEACCMMKDEREKIAKKFGRVYLIDEWVTRGGSRLIRLPYSLHGMVSRICLPLEIGEIKNFDPRKDRRNIPEFIRAL